MSSTRDEDDDATLIRADQVLARALELTGELAHFVKTLRAEAGRRSESGEHE